MNGMANNGAGGHTAPASIQNSGSHPRHFQVGESNHGGDRSLQETALRLRAYRQQLIAAKIANADTPGYQAVGLDFEQALRIARPMATTPPLTLSAMASGYISGQSQSSAPPYKYQIPSQASADGNTVEMDVERSRFAENSVMWELARDRVGSHYQHMMEMLQNLKD